MGNHVLVAEERRKHKKGLWSGYVFFKKWHYFYGNLHTFLKGHFAQNHWIMITDHGHSVHAVCCVSSRVCFARERCHGASRLWSPRCMWRAVSVLVIVYVNTDTRFAQPCSCASLFISLRICDSDAYMLSCDEVHIRFLPEMPQCTKMSLDKWYALAKM